MSFERLLLILGRGRILMNLFKYLLEIFLPLQVLSDLLVVLLPLVCHLHVHLRLINEWAQLIEFDLILVLRTQLLHSVLVLSVDGPEDGLVHTLWEHSLQLISPSLLHFETGLCHGLGPLCDLPLLLDRFVLFLWCLLIEGSGHVF